MAVSLLLSRLPPTADLFLPRRPFFGIFHLAMGISQSPTLSATVSGLAFIFLVLALGGFLWDAALLLKPAGKGRRVLWVSLSAAGSLVLGVASWLVLRAALDLIQYSCFEPGSLDIREPLTAFISAFLAVLLLWRSALAFLRAAADAQGRRRALTEGLILGALLIVGAAGLSALAGGRARPEIDALASSAGLPPQPRAVRAVILLTEGRDGPDYEVHEIALGIAAGDYSMESLASLENHIRRGSVSNLRQALSHLYGGYTVQMEARALRGALFLAHEKGDPLAGFLLLQNLMRAPSGAGHEGLLDALADETSFRIGPRAAAMLSMAYGNFGSVRKADYWREFSSSVMGGIPAGLLNSPGPPLNGAIRGKVLGLGPVKVVLYARGEEGAPYNLGASALVDSKKTDGGGGFEFSGLPAGRYFLALSFNFRSPPLSFSRLGKCVLGAGSSPPCVSFISNHRGDITLSVERPRAELGALSAHFLTPSSRPRRSRL